MWKGSVVGKGAWFEIEWNGTTDKVNGKAGRREWVREHQDELLEDMYVNAEAYYEALLSGVEVKV
jgi:hypothetical protein